MPMKKINVTANWSMSVDFDVKKILGVFAYVEQNIDEAVSDGIYDYLEFFKKVALATKPWADRTGNLRNSHEIVPTEDGWSLVVDSTKNGTATWKGRPYNYAYALEQGWLSNKYKWLQPTADQTRDDLIYYVARKVKKVIDDAIKKYNHVLMTSSTGKQYVMLQYPTGSIDPITGKNIGGKFFRKL